MAEQRGFGKRVARHMIPGVIALTLIAGVFTYAEANPFFTVAAQADHTADSIQWDYARDAYAELRNNRVATAILFDSLDEDGGIAEAGLLRAARDLHMTVRIVHTDESVIAYPTSLASAN